MNALIRCRFTRAGVGGVAGRRVWLLGLWLSIAGPTLAAAPFTPSNPDQVVEKLPLQAGDPQPVSYTHLHDFFRCFLSEIFRQI